MSTIDWINGAGGDWSNGADWSGGTVPTTSDDATIGVAGTYTVAVTGSDSANNVTLTDSQATLAIDSDGTLNLGGTLSLDAGTLQLNSGGVIRGGTVAMDGGILAATDGTLDGVTFDGPVTIGPIFPPTGHHITVAHQLTLRGAGGVGPGSLTLSSDAPILVFAGTQTLDNATINMDYNGDLEVGDSTGNAILTLGANLVLNADVTKFPYPGGYTIFPGPSPFTHDLINLGTINGGFYAQGFDSIVNKGTMNLDSTSIGAGYFENDGTINATDDIDGNGSIIGGTTQFVNKGTLRNENEFLDIIFSKATTADLGTIININGTIQLAYGVLDNTGSILRTGTGNPLGTLQLYSVTIVGGTIQNLGSGTRLLGETFDGVTYEGTLALGAVYSPYVTDGLTVADGITLTGADGTGPGRVTIGFGANLAFTGATTLDNATIVVTTAGGGGSVSTDSVLTLGAHLTIDAYGGLSLSGAVVNDGTINAFGGAAYSAFTNNGTIEVAQNGGFTLDGASFTNLSGTTLTGGIYDVRSGAALGILEYSTAPLPGIVTIDADVTLVGANSEILYQDTLYLQEQTVSFEDRFTTIGAAGKLRLLGGRGLDSTLAIEDDGLLQLGGGTFAAASLTIGASGSLTGFGTVAVTVADGGMVEAASGVLDLAGGLSGGGKAEVGPTATLEIAGSSAVPVAFLAASGVLALDQAAGFTGKISGLRIGDTIRLEDVTATQALVHGSILAVTLAGGGEIDYAVAGNFANAAFQVQNGGHDLVLSPAASGSSFTLTNGVDNFSGTPGGTNTVTAPPGTLTKGDAIDGGAGSHTTLVLSGPGIFDLRLPASLANIGTLSAQEGQASYAKGGIAGTAETLYLRDGLDLTVAVANDPSFNAANPNPDGITIYGADNADAIHLGTGTNVVVLGSASESVQGGAGNDTVKLAASMLGATLDGGGGANALQVTGGGTGTMGAAITNFQVVQLQNAGSAYDFTANSTPGLRIVSSSANDTLRAGAGGDVLWGHSGDIFVMNAAGHDTVQGSSNQLDGTTIENFSSLDAIDVTDFATPSHVTATLSAGTLDITDSTLGRTVAISLPGSFSGAFAPQSDGHGGTAINFEPGVVPAAGQLAQAIGSLGAAGSSTSIMSFPAPASAESPLAVSHG